MHLKKWDYHESFYWNISKTETLIHSRFITSILMIRANSSWKSKIQYFKILEYFLWSIKKRICKRKSSSCLKYGDFCTQYLFGPTLAQAPASVKCGSGQSVALMRNYWVFSSSGLLDPPFLIFLLEISHRSQMGFRSGMLSGQSSTVISWSALGSGFVSVCMG